MDVTFDETESFYMHPQLQGESSIEVESSFVPFVQKPSNTNNTLGNLDTSLGHGCQNRDLACKIVRVYNILPHLQSPMT